VAVELDPSAAGPIARLIEQLRSEVSNVRWTRPDQLHVTLKFLGDIDNRELPRLCAILREVCAECEPFTAKLRGIGTFPKNKPPRVIWASITEGTEAFRELYTRLERQLAELGIPREGRAYTPHLTLGRVGRGADLDQLQSALEVASQQLSATLDVSELLLYSSTREREGIIYDCLDRVDL
jgi:2'-5' RNA ligase